MTALLPPELASRYTAVPLTPKDEDAVFALMTAYRVAVLGSSRFPRAVAHVLLANPSALVVGIRAGDRLVQVWEGVLHPGDASPIVAVTTDPLLAGDPDREALELVGWRRLFRWAAAVLPGVDPVELRTYRPLLDRDARDRLGRLGFAERRVLWTMETSVDEERSDGRPPPDGLVVREAADPRLVHEVFMAGFAGTFDFEEMSLEDFVANREALPGADRALWCLATIAGQPVGAMTMTRGAPERSAMHVSELAVLPTSRGRGVATALLHHAFGITRREGMRLVYLFVDSESEDDAPSLYASVGFATVQAQLQLARSVGPDDL